MISSVYTIPLISLQLGLIKHIITKPSLERQFAMAMLPCISDYIFKITVSSRVLPNL